jgi:hypothetical protein
MMEINEQKYERCLAIKRMRTQAEKLRNESRAAYSKINDIQRSTYIRPGSASAMSKLKEMQQLVVDATRAENEAKQIDRCIDHAVMTFMRDYNTDYRGEC